MYQCEIITTLVGCTHQEKDIILYVVRFGSWGRFSREAPRRRGSVRGGGTRVEERGADRGSNVACQLK